MQHKSPLISAGQALLPKSPPTFAQLLADSATWALSIMTSPICDADRQRFREALTAFAAERGLQAHCSSGTTCIALTNASITAEDRGAVIGWLCSRPEVHFVHVHRRLPQTRSLVVACAPSRAADQVPPVWADGQHGSDEDLSQEIDAHATQQEARHAC
jgi:hypothetical protein